MEIKSVVVIDDNGNSRIDFGIALEEIREDLDYYPFEHIDEALTIPNALIMERPDIIFINIDAYFSHGLLCISRLKHIDQYGDVPIVVYSGREIDKKTSESLGAFDCFQKPDSINLLVKLLASILNA
jgi:DNA-binding NtrC family response regulator